MEPIDAPDAFHETHFERESNEPRSPAPSVTRDEISDLAYLWNGWTPEFRGTNPAQPVPVVAPGAVSTLYLQQTKEVTNGWRTVSLTLSRSENYWTVTLDTCRENGTPETRRLTVRSFIRAVYVLRRVAYIMDKGVYMESNDEETEVEEPEPPNSHITTTELPLGMTFNTFQSVEKVFEHHRQEGIREEEYQQIRTVAEEELERKGKWYHVKQNALHEKARRERNQRKAHSEAIHWKARKEWRAEQYSRSVVESIQTNGIEQRALQDDLDMTGVSELSDQYARGELTLEEFESALDDELSEQDSSFTGEIDLIGTADTALEQDEIRERMELA